LLLAREGGEQKPGLVITAHGLPPEDLRRLADRNWSQGILPVLGWAFSRRTGVNYLYSLSLVFSDFGIESMNFEKRNNEAFGTSDQSASPLNRGRQRRAR
jgi:hypothetical protein